MKILILNHNQERLGTYWRCFFFAKQLSSLGHNITMICASGKRFDLLIRTKQINQKFKIITLPRICYHKYFTGQALLRLPLTCLLVLILKYDLLYAFTVAQPQIAIPAIVSKIIRKKTLIIDWDDIWGKGLGLYHGHLINSIFYFFERKTLLFADKITYVSCLLGKEIKKLGFSHKAKKFPNGADYQNIKPITKTEALKKLHLDKNKKYLLSLGNTYTTSLNLLITSFQLAAKKVKNLQLILVGAAQAPVNLSKNIICQGSRPYQEIPYWLSAADILVLPMENNLFEKARFPIRLGDYLCAKKPIISNAVGEVKYYLKNYHCGLITKSNKKELTQAIIKLSQNPSLGKNMALRARALAKNELSWITIGQKLEIWLTNKN